MDNRGISDTLNTVKAASEEVQSAVVEWRPHVTRLLILGEVLLAIWILKHLFGSSSSKKTNVT
jgi:hypothetical protein